MGYFDLYLNRVYREDEIVLVEKDVYYGNIILLIQRLQSLVIFRGATLLKINIAISLQDSALEWYTFELSKFD